MKESLYDFCMRTGNLTLLSEWDKEKNNHLSPVTTAASSSQKVWWTCAKGHSWQTTVEKRTKRHTGCPYCSGKKPIPGETDLATRFPDIAAEWDQEKNGDLSPQEVRPGSNKKVWWRCKKGHSYQARIDQRTIKKTGCPYCAGKAVLSGYNDLATKYPAITKEWHPTKNEDLTPSQVTAHSGKKVWWQCTNGHDYLMTIHERTSQGAGCPYCAGTKVLPGFNDLKIRYPEIAKEWHPTKNGELTPDKVLPRSKRKVWWLCKEGHSYQTSLVSRTQSKTGCPYCTRRKVLPGFNDLATEHPDLAKEWHPTLNGDLTPDQIISGSDKKVWWICDEGHVWQASVKGRTGTIKRGCPVCAGNVKKKNKGKP